MAKSKKAAAKKSPQSSQPSPSNYGAHLVNLAREIGPDAFVLGLVPLAVIYAVIKGADPLPIFGFSLIAIMTYAGLSLARMRYLTKIKEAEIAAIYAAGEARLKRAIE